MNHDNHFVRSRLFVTWLLSYLFILLLPLTLGYIVSNHAYQTICEEVQTINENALEQLQSAADSRFTALNKIGGNMSLSSDVKLLLSAKESFYGKKMLNVIRVQEMLGSYLLTDSLIDEIWLYMPNQQCFLSSTYKFNADSMDEFCHVQLSMEPQALREISMKRDPARFRVITQEGSQPCVLYFVPLFTNGYARPSGLLIVRIDNSQLAGMMDNVSRTQGADVLIINSRGECFENRHNTFNGVMPDYAGIRDMSRTSNLKADGQQYTMSHLDSGIQDIQFVSLTPTSAYQQKAWNVRRITGYYGLACLLIGMFLAIVFTKKNYDPIRRMKHILQKGHTSSLNTNDEYQMMEAAINDLLKTESEISMIRERHRETQRNNLLLRLLLGRESYTDASAALLAAYGIHFLGESFMAVELIAADDPSAEQIRVMYSSDNGEILTRAIHEIGLSILDDHYTSVMALINGNYVFIINTGDDEQSEAYRQVREDMEKIQSFILERFGIEFCVNISAVHLGREAIANAYSDSMLIQEYRRFYGQTDSVLSIEDFDRFGSEDDLSWLGTAEQRQFRACLETNDFRTAENVLKEAFRKMPESLHSARLLTSRAITLAGAIENYISALPTEPDDQTHRELMKIFRDITRSESAASVFEYLNTLLLKAEELAGQQCRDTIPECVEKAMEYISSHYAERDLNVSSVADAIGFSAAYLSRTFKKARKIGLLDYIHMTRLQKAKEYIKTKSVTEVAEMVGYYDSKALIAAFKRYEGTTPGKFRAQFND